MLPALPYALGTLVCGVAAIWGKHPGRLFVHWVAKPATLLCILAATLASPTRLPAAAYPWLIAALALSLLGDVCLMFKDRLFVAGLVAFLLAHLAYLTCFGLEAGSLTSGATYLFVPLPVALCVGRALWPHLGKLRPAVILYIAALVLVAWRLLARFTFQDEVGLTSCLYAAAGALLFLLSDSLLALRHFAKRTFPYALELGAYFGAQWCIARATWQ